ncbi:MAG TPA: dNTP triphosphohydrolase [Candidatus Acidoferrales bacterium]|nr:dNTP triphosphohydrolase [Candidatus Acidoferrales bacterium]
MKRKRKRNEKFDAADWHRKLLKTQRYKPGGSSVKGREVDEEAASDRARVIYSSAFRRLQNKTQVFTLSKDAAVRTRLTHSLEVASVGRWIAQTVVDKALRDAGLEDAFCSALVSLVETACLAHDIGNPPFGHFGESAIQGWFRDEWERVAAQRAEDKNLQQLVQDFMQFDGNPQGTRILMRLQGRTQEERRKYGMNLTYSQVLTSLKYPRGPLDEAKWKKAGFFESERSKIEEAWKALNFQVTQRFPLAYLVEAADDISYCISDMEDGIDQGVFTPRQFFDGIQKWTKKRKPSPHLAKLRETAKSCRRRVARTSDRAKAKDQFTVFKTAFSRAMIAEAARAYGDGGSDDIRDGTRSGLLDCTDADGLLENLKDIARQFLYPADKVQRPFLAGLKVTRGILDEYSKLLYLTQEHFALLRKAWRSADRKAVHEQHLQTFLPLLDGLPAHYLDVYDSTARDALSLKRWGKETWEWFCRAHLIVDYLSGMTDDFAYRTYQVISGAQLE